MSKRLPWFRMYADFLNDPKLISLAFEDQRHFIGVLALKCDGAIDDVADGDLLDRIVAQRLWIDHAVIREVKRRLIAACLIDARWQPLAWEKRQMRSDVDATGAERQRRYREAQKHNALRDAAVTRLDTDTDTDTDKEEDKKKATRKRAAPSFFVLPDWIDANHWEAWHSSAKRRNATPQQKQMAVDKLAKWRDEGLDHAAALEYSAIGGYQGLFKPSPSHQARASPPQSKHAAAARAIYGAPSNPEFIDVETVVRQH